MSTRSLAAFLHSPAGAAGPAWRKVLPAVVLMIVASALFALQAALVKSGLEHLPPLELVFFRSLVCAALIFALARVRGQSLATAHPLGQLTLGTIGFVSLGLYFAAIGMLPLVTATALNYTAPLFLALVLAAQRTRPAHIWVATGFIGVCLVLQPSFSGGSTAAVLIALLSGLTGAFCYLLLSRLGRGGEPHRVTAFYFSLITCVLAGVPTLVSGFSIATRQEVMLVLAIGLLATLAQLAIAKAYAIASPLIPSTLSYSTVVFSSVFGAVWWGDSLNFSTALGVALIVAGGVLISAAHANEPARTAPELEELKRRREHRKNVVRSLYAAFMLGRDPNQTRYVFMMGVAQDDIAEAQRAQGKMTDPFASATLEAMWQTRFQAPRYDIQQLSRLPAHTLGGAYARHMEKNGLRPDYYREVTPRHRMQYLRERIHQTHDVWHIVTGFSTDEFGEVGLQGFYFAQFTNGQAALIGAVAILKSLLRGQFSDLEKHIDTFCQGYCSGKRAERLFEVKWEELWNESLEEVRKRYRIEPPRCRAGMLPSS